MQQILEDDVPRPGGDGGFVFRLLSLPDRGVRLFLDFQVEIAGAERSFFLNFQLTGMS